MASWQDSLSKTAGQLRDLSVSQKLTVLFGAALIGLSLLWLGNWAATSEYTPLLSQDMSASELESARAALEAMNVPVRVQGSRLMVSAAANRSALLAQLGLSDKLPGDTSIGFEQLVKEANPWISSEENNKRWTVAVAGELEKILRQFQGVKDAKVMLNMNGPKRGFARVEPVASASVFLTMKSGEPVSRSLAVAAARMVSGAVRGLPLRNVQVVDGNGAVALDWAAESDGGTQMDRLRREQESHVADKIRAQLAFDPAVRVSVRVELDPTARVKKATRTEDGAETRRRERQEETTRGRAAAAPGVQPNVGSAIGGGSGADRSVTTENEIENQPSVTQTDEQTAPGETKEVFAAVLLSHSYLSGVVRRNSPDARDVTLAQVEDEFKRQSARVINQVKQLVKPQAESQVAVDWYYDEIGAAPPADAPSASDVSLGYLARYGPLAGLSMLALLSLGLVLRLSKKADSGEAFGIEIGLPKEAINQARKAAKDVAVAAARNATRTAAAAAPSAQAPAAADDDRPAAVATAPLGQEAEALLEAPEVDLGTLQVRSMVEQIARMAEADAGAMATMIEKWVDRPRN